MLAPTRAMLAVVLVEAALGGACARRAAPPPELPSARAPELAAIGPRCDGATLRGFDPGLAGLERVAVAPRPVADAPLVREHVRPCEPIEADEACRVRAQREVAAADATARIVDVTLDGELDGWAGTLEVDGERLALRVANRIDLLAQARRLEAAGHQVVPIDGRAVLRAEGRRAVVRYEVPLPGAPARSRWEAELRWPAPADAAAALARLTAATAAADLELVWFEMTDDGRHVAARVVCPE